MDEVRNMNWYWRTGVNRRQLQIDRNIDNLLDAGMEPTTYSAWHLASVTGLSSQLFRESIERVTGQPMILPFRRARTRSVNNNSNRGRARTRSPSLGYAEMLRELRSRPVTNNSNSNRRSVNNNNNSRGWEQPPKPTFYNTRNTRNNAAKALTLLEVPYGVSMPVTNRRDEVISLEDVPFEEQVYLADNLNAQGQARRVYALPSIVGLLNQKNPVTRKRFAASNIKRVAR